MLAYVELIQRKEKELGCDVLTHQKWYVGTSPQMLLCLSFVDSSFVAGVARATLTASFQVSHCMALFDLLLTLSIVFVLPISRLVWFIRYLSDRKRFN
jgi:hypothetical protein